MKLAILVVSLILYVPVSAYKFSIRSNKRSRHFLLDNHFVKSNQLFSWVCVDTVQRKLVLVTVFLKKLNAEKWLYRILRVRMSSWISLKRSSGNKGLRFSFFVPNLDLINLVTPVIKAFEKEN